MVTVPRFIAIALIFIVAMPVLADDWADGNEAFQRGDFSAALDYFVSARSAGLTGPAVHYNIAVCQYKLSRFAEAGKTFAGIARDYPKMAGLAEYNLGLVAQKLGDTDGAAGHFLNAYRLSTDDEKLRILASNRLADGLADGVADTAPLRRFRGAVGVRAGHDDNVALRDTAGISTGTTEASSMMDIFASVSGPVAPQLDDLSFDASLYAVRYFDADEFDQNGLDAGLLYAWQRGRWRFTAGPQVGAGWLGGDAFDRRIGVRIAARRSLDDGAMLRLTYDFDDISDGDVLFRGIEGRRHLIEARYSRRSADGRRLGVRLRHETNDRLDAGVSPSRTGISVDYLYPLTTDWSLEAGLALRLSRFTDVLLPREEDLLTLKASGLRRLSRDWSLFLDYRFSDNDSDDPAFSYDRNAINVGVMRSF